MAWFATAAPYLISAAGTIGAGSSAENAAKFQSKQLKQQANAAAATASLKVEQDRRETRYMESRAQAVAAASGGTATDKTVLDIIGRISKEGEYKALTDLWLGNEAFLNYSTAADVVKQQGQTARNLSYLGAAGTLYKGYGASKAGNTDLGIMNGTSGLSRYYNETVLSDAPWNTGGEDPYGISRRTS